ncbi:putative serine/threonine phosphatase [Leptomonas pyrrhocoris]|uniref:Putative serine/threonine phosphatase n=1 Tax=Leptomonas pyrrhocoris TaxID=157538 RepID=A0A0N0DXW4_LEPPY|nr:putative serine/threonine phosphatase [Leptomonas pyrrhocoris]KPA83455.1 putative serine/threonine phosphatase [Leptomonas pyrrhocoris]|eukprot:XP_015661894.1 putative serine/threonine phosphatase [Leptomonas pyrrhocoris]
MTLQRSCFSGLRGTGLLVLFTLLVLQLGAEARRIVAVGDLHGDYEQSVSVLRLTNLVDNNTHWIGEDAFLVQLGDILDVGPDDIKIVKLLMRLQKEAQARGGDVVELLGNHELRNFRGDYTAVDQASLAANGGKEGRDTLLSNATAVGTYLRTRKAIFHYGPFLFMHGGFSTATASMITSLKRVEDFNAELTQALMNGTISPLASDGLDLAEDDVEDVGNPILVRSILNVKCDELAKVLKKKFPGIDFVVVGHVPHDPRDFNGWRLCNGRLIDIDFGMSRWKKGDPGHVAALEIEEATWHTQLIETSTAIGPIATDDVAASDAVTAHHLLRLSMLIVGVVLLAFLIAYCVPFRSAIEQEPLLDWPATTYGAA